MNNTLDNAIKFMYSDAFEINARNMRNEIVLTVEINSVAELYTNTLEFAVELAKFKEDMRVEIYSLFLDAPISLIRYDYRDIMEDGGLDIYKFACSLIATLYEEFELR